MHEAGYDVLAARAQRAEAEGAPKPYLIKLGARRFFWPAELPAAAVELAGQLQGVTDDKSPESAALLAKLVRALSGEHADELISLLSLNDLADLMPKYMEHVAGSGLGEPGGSPASSPGTPKPRKRTSKPRTGSTSSTTTAAA